MKMRLFLLLTVVLTFGLVSSSGCYPSDHNGYFYTAKDKKEKKSKKGWLGVSISDVTRSLANRKDLVTNSGAYITDVTSNSPADDAGIEEGDVILKFNGKTIDDSGELTDAVRATKPGTTVDVVVERDKEKKTFKVEIDALKTSNSFSFNWDEDEEEPFRVQVPKPPRAGAMPRVQVFTTNSSLYGLKVESLTKQLAEYFEVPGKKGVLVTEVKKSSVADKAGFKAGDVITKVGSSSVWDTDDLRDEFRDADKGDEYAVEVYRKGKSTSLKMKFDRDSDEDEDDWSINVVPHGGSNTYHYQFRNNEDELDHTTAKQREELRQLKRKIHDALKEGLRETHKGLQEMRDELRRELNNL